MSDPSVVVALIAIVATVAQGVINWFTLKDVKKAQVADSLTTSAVRIVNELQEEVERIKNKVSALELVVIGRDRRIRELEEENARLTKEAKELRIKLGKLEKEGNHGTK